MEPIDVVAQVGLISVIVQKVLERVRARFPGLDGSLVSVYAALAGVGIAWGYDLRAAFELTGVALQPALDYIVTGLAIGAGSGFVADVTGRSGSGTVTVATGPVDRG